MYMAAAEPPPYSNRIRTARSTSNASVYVTVNSFAVRLTATDRR
jgi:hypothetical protein